jgi:TPR repeat protein
MLKKIFFALIFSLISFWVYKYSTKDNDLEIINRISKQKSDLSETDISDLRKASQNLCTEGDFQMCHRTGHYMMSYEPVDLDEAQKYFELACDQGIKEACSMPKLMQENIKNMKNIAPDNQAYVRQLVSKGSFSLSHKNYELALEYLNEACQLNDYSACGAVATIKTNPESTLGVNTIEGIQYAKKGCDGQDKMSCTYLASLYEQDKKTEDAHKAYTLACQYGDEFSCKEAMRLSR